MICNSRSQVSNLSKVLHTFSNKIQCRKKDLRVKWEVAEKPAVKFSVHIWENLALVLDGL
jgi:hypothetical protein